MAKKQSKQSPSESAKKTAHVPQGSIENTSVKPFKPESDSAEKELSAIQHGYSINSERPVRSEIKKLAFLDAYNRFITPAHTCQAIGVSLNTFYLWLNSDPKFSQAFQIVERHLTDRLVRVAAARAIKGSDNLLMFMLKARDPRFREKLQAELDPKQVDALVRDIVGSLRKNIPNTCPHCKKGLNLSEKVEEMLADLSKGTAS